jgi:three-Cys-motif partner protein
VVANDDFFQRKQAAAVLKHGVLSRYMAVFASMTGSASTGGRVHYIDGYAGPGRYEPEDGQSVGSPGSPLLAAGTAARLSTAKRDLRCTFIERDPTYAANLAAVLGEEWQGGGSYEVKEGEVETHLAAAVAAAGKNPLLIFLDPFGTALAYDLLVQQIVGRPKGALTEVLLNFNIDSVRRIGGRLLEDLAPGTSRFDARELTLRRIDGFLGGDWWRQVYLDNYGNGAEGSAGRAATAVADQFRMRLGAATGLKSIDVPVRRRPGHVPLFLLTLFYSHAAAGYQFADAAALANGDWRAYNRLLDLAEEIEKANTAPSLFAVDDILTSQAEKDADAAEARLHAEWVDRVAANIRQLVRDHPVLPLAASVADLYGTAFGVAGEKHLRAAWDRVASEGLVQAREKAKRMWSQTIIRATP